MKKWEAEKKLQQIIESESGTTACNPDPTVTLSWFWENRFLPLQVQWRGSTRVVLDAIFRNHVLSEFGSVRLEAVKRFDLQAHLNALRVNTRSRL